MKKVSSTNWMAKLSRPHRSLQEIADYYIRLGYTGNRLKEILENDKKYQEILKERKNILTLNFKVTKTEKRKYVLSTDADFEILEKCKKLENFRLSTNDRELVNLIKSQLENDWRKHLTATLNKLLNKYQ